jgi:hypothetical protein
MLAHCLCVRADKRKCGTQGRKNSRIKRCNGRRSYVVTSVVRGELNPIFTRITHPWPRVCWYCVRPVSFGETKEAAPHTWRGGFFRLLRSILLGRGIRFGGVFRQVQPCLPHAQPLLAFVERCAGFRYLATRRGIFAKSLGRRHENAGQLYRRLLNHGYRLSAVFFANSEFASKAVSK